MFRPIEELLFCLFFKYGHEKLSYYYTKRMAIFTLNCSRNISAETVLNEDMILAIEKRGQAFTCD